MTAEATTYVPSWAIPCWVDNHTLYFALKGPDDTPIVTSFARHELGKALTILFQNYEVEGHGQVYIQPAVVAKKLIAEGVTPKDMESAKEALKQLGILK